MKPRNLLVCVLVAATIPFLVRSDDTPPTQSENPPKDPPATTESAEPPATPPAAAPPPVVVVVEVPATNAPAAALTSTPPHLSGPAREILKLASAGVPDEVIRAYLDSSSSTFNLNADQMIYLQSVHFPGSLTAAMLLHDKSLHDESAAALAAQPPSPPAPQPPVNAQPGIIYPPVQEEITQNPVQIAYIPNRDYNPYGGWQYAGDFGWYWQPYSWAGYPWGLAGLETGRWWMHPRAGLVWSQGVQVKRHQPTMRTPVMAGPPAPVQAPKAGVQRFTTGRVQFTTGSPHH